MHLRLLSPEFVLFPQLVPLPSATLQEEMCFGCWLLRRIVVAILARSFLNRAKDLGHCPKPRWAAPDFVSRVVNVGETSPLPAAPMPEIQEQKREDSSAESTKSSRCQRASDSSKWSVISTVLVNNVMKFEMS